jgi:hypothetical protein
LFDVPGVYDGISARVAASFSKPIAFSKPVVFSRFVAFSKRLRFQEACQFFFARCVLTKIENSSHRIPKKPNPVPISTKYAAKINTCASSGKR